MLRGVGGSRLIPLGGNHFPAVLDDDPLKHVPQSLAVGGPRSQDAKAGIPEMLHDVLNDPLHLEQGRHGGAEPIPSESLYVRKSGGGSNKRHLSKVGHVGDALNLLCRQRSDQGNRIEFLNQA